MSYLYILLDCVPSVNVHGSYTETIIKVRYLLIIRRYIVIIIMCAYQNHAETFLIMNINIHQLRKYSKYKRENHVYTEQFNFEVVLFLKLILYLKTHDSLTLFVAERISQSVSIFLKLSQDRCSSQICKETNKTIQKINKQIL